MLKSKKAQSWMTENIGKLILMVAIMLVIIFIPYNVSQAAPKAYSTAACKTKALLNAGVRIPIAQIELTNANCATLFYYIGMDKITGETSEGDKLPDISLSCGNKKDEEKAQCFFNKVNQHLAKTMYSCWDQFGRGQLDVYSGTDRHCSICARIEFKDDVKKFISGKYEPHQWKGATENCKQNVDSKQNDNGKEIEPCVLDEYMRSHSHPANSEISYYEFLLDNGEDAFKLPYYDYDINEVYAVVFKNEYPPSIKTLLSEGWHTVKCGGEFAGQMVFGKGDDEELCTDIKADIKTRLKDVPKAATANSFIRYSEIKQGCDELK